MHFLGLFVAIAVIVANVEGTSISPSRTYLPPGVQDSYHATGYGQGIELKNDYVEVSRPQNVYLPPASVQHTPAVHHYQAAPVHHYQTAAVHHYQTAPVHHYQSAPVHHYQSAPVHHYQSAPVHHYQSAPVHHYQTAPVHHYNSAPRYVSHTAVHHPTVHHPTVHHPTVHHVVQRPVVQHVVQHVSQPHNVYLPPAAVSHYTAPHVSIPTHHQQYTPSRTYLPPGSEYV